MEAPEEWFIWVTGCARRPETTIDVEHSPTTTSRQNLALERFVGGIHLILKGTNLGGNA